MVKSIKYIVILHEKMNQILQLIKKIKQIQLIKFVLLQPNNNRVNINNYIVQVNAQLKNYSTEWEQGQNKHKFKMAQSKIYNKQENAFIHLKAALNKQQSYLIIPIDKKI